MSEYTIEISQPSYTIQLPVIVQTGGSEQIQSDWNQTNNTAKDYIKNKPAIPTKTSDLTNDSNFVVDANYVHTDNNLTTDLKNEISIEWFGFAASDETSNLSTGTSKFTIPYFPFAAKILAIIIEVNTAPTGSTLIVDINKNTVSIFSTRISIDAGEISSETAATPYVLATVPTDIAKGDSISVDIDAIGLTIAGAGLKVFFKLIKL